MRLYILLKIAPNLEQGRVTHTNIFKVAIRKLSKFFEVCQEYDKSESIDWESDKQQSANDDSSDDHVEKIAEMLKENVQDDSDASLHLSRELVKLRDYNISILSCTKQKKRKHM